MPCRLFSQHLAVVEGGRKLTHVLLGAFNLLDRYPKPLAVVNVKLHLPRYVGYNRSRLTTC